MAATIDTRSAVNSDHHECLVGGYTVSASSLSRCRCGQLGAEVVELRRRLHAAEAAARASEEAAAAQQQRLVAWVDRQERAARRNAEVYQRLRSAHAVDRGARLRDATCLNRKPASVSGRPHKYQRLATPPLEPGSTGNTYRVRRYQLYDFEIVAHQTTQHYAARTGVRRPCHWRCAGGGMPGVAPLRDRRRL